MAVGQNVGVWNRDAAKTKPLTETGAKLFSSPAELVEGCDVVIVMLVYCGKGRPKMAGFSGRCVTGSSKKLIDGVIGSNRPLLRT